MKKSTFFLILLIVLAAVITSYWYGKSCSYCFQNKLANQVLNEEKTITFPSSYSDNVINTVKHSSLNIIGQIVGTVLKNSYLQALFWVLLSTFTCLLLFKKVFSSFEIGFFSALVYLTNTTLFVTIHHIFYYFLTLYCIYLFISKGKKIYLIFSFVLLFLALNTDISSAFTIFITIISLYFFNLVLNRISGTFDKKELYLVFSLLVLLMVTVLFEKAFVSDFFHRLPSILGRSVFYIESYPKGLYFYLYLISKGVLVIAPIVYFLKNILALCRKKRLETKDRFIFSYFLTIIPILLLFSSFGVIARFFDYYSPLFAAITVKKLKNKRILLTLLGLFLIFFSIFAHYIPPRSLERYDLEFEQSLYVLPPDSIIYTDTFVANFLISEMEYEKVVGPDFNKGDEYVKVYYERDQDYIQNLFEEKKVDYFVISKHSLIRGLDVLNAPHFLKPVKNVEEYDNMGFLEKYYSDEQIMVWKVKR